MRAGGLSSMSLLQISSSVRGVVLRGRDPGGETVFACVQEKLYKFATTKQNGHLLLICLALAGDAFGREPRRRSRHPRPRC